ncbi:hypothetical protein BCR42DRAFT_99483 [Absidia repens]|uniref:Uncharacterized protein n=1 Tax=Absidia repens TaxID=90262 RepID=A0A1X2I9C1_9FUNG|nr:hypothetical protein BCR42DRAFT_99483 [Absidia repens]
MSMSMSSWGWGVGTYYLAVDQFPSSESLRTSFSGFPWRSALCCWMGGRERGGVDALEVESVVVYSLITMMSPTREYIYVNHALVFFSFTLAIFRLCF